jgi:hypothetical protein
MMVWSLILAFISGNVRDMTQNEEIWLVDQMLSVNPSRRPGSVTEVIARLRALRRASAPVAERNTL